MRDQQPRIGVAQHMLQQSALVRGVERHEHGAEVTLGEIGDIYRQVWGDWTTPIQT